MPNAPNTMDAFHSIEEVALMLGQGAKVECQCAPDLLEACQRIVDLSAGWNKNGSTGPRHPLSWESVGRVAMDYARYALSKIEEG